MKNKNIIRIIKSIVYGFIALVQISLITIVVVINHLTTKKAGVMRHVYSRRLQYQEGIYSSNNLLKHSLFGGILAILFIILLIYALNRKQSLFLKVQLVLGSSMGLLIPIVINSNFFINTMSYPYFIMAFELILIIQIVVIASTYLISSYK